MEKRKGPAVKGHAKVMPVEIRLGTHLLLHWTTIAVEQEKLALAAREAVLRAQGLREEFDLATELRPAMLTTTAAALALDALYGELAPDVIPPAVAKKWRDPKRKISRRVRVLEVARASTSMNLQSHAAEFKWLFAAARDPAVHPLVEMLPAEEHPLGFRASATSVLYSAEGATRAVDLLMAVLHAVVDHPSSTAAGWVERMRHAVEPLIASR